MSKPLDLIGRQIGNLTVVRKAGLYRKQQVWECECSCGEKIEARGCHLTAEKIQSCGCKQYEPVHGHARRKQKTPEYVAYGNAKARCNNSKNPGFNCYGGRGIRFLFSSFLAFIQELGRRPSSEYSLDRIDNDGNYETGNVRWTTRSEQSLNQRRSLRYA